MASSAACYDSLTVSIGQPTTSAVMFGTGVVGNLFALVLLAMRCRRKRLSLFYVLVTALLMKDLLGTLSVSPLVLTSYFTNRTLVGMSEGRRVCFYFGFSMTFLSLATLANLCAMALERYLALGHPYFYERHLSRARRCGYIIIPLIYLGCILFCVTPFMGFGSYVQYCPGTWCFLDTNPDNQKDKVYAGLYATFTLVMISVTVACNVCVIYHLLLMHRRRSANRTGTVRLMRLRSLSVTYEVEQLLLLVFITVAFSVCSFPLMTAVCENQHFLVPKARFRPHRPGSDQMWKRHKVQTVYFRRPFILFTSAAILLRVYFNFTCRREEDFTDLLALRMLSFNSIIDPWVFIIFSPSVLRFFWRKIQSRQKPPSLHEKALSHPRKADLGQPYKEPHKHDVDRKNLF